MGLAERDRTGQTCSRIATGIVRLYARLYGKGPTNAKARIVDDAVICVLRGGVTPVERTLIERGDADAARRIRESLHDATSSRMQAVVEEATRREVTAHVSQTHVDPDVAVELFSLG